MRLPLILCLSLAACAPSAADVAAAGDRAANEQAAVERELVGYVPEGPPQGCLSGIDRRISDGSRQIGGSVLFRIRQGTIIRNDMNGGCNFRNDPILVTQTPTTQLCRGDIVQLLDRTTRFPIGSCAYGDFTTYRRADKR